MSLDNMFAEMDPYSLVSQIEGGVLIVQNNIPGLTPTDQRTSTTFVRFSSPNGVPTASVENFDISEGTTQRLIRGKKSIIRLRRTIDGVSIDSWDASEGWKVGAAMLGVRRGASLVVVNDDKILLTGGVEGDEIDISPSNSVCIVDLVTGSVRNSTPMTWSRVGHRSFALSSQQVVVFGGVEGTGSTKDCGETAIFDLATETWQRVGSMSKNREGASIVQFESGEILVAGGGVSSDTETNESSVTNSSEIFDVGSSIWRGAAPMPIALCYSGSTPFGSDMAVLCGGTSKAGEWLMESSKDVQIYDLSSNSWRESDSLKHYRFAPSICPIDNEHLLVVGGYERDTSVPPMEIVHI